MQCRSQYCRWSLLSLRAARKLQPPQDSSMVNLYSSMHIFVNYCRWLKDLAMQDVVDKEFDTNYVLTLSTLRIYREKKKNTARCILFCFLFYVIDEGFNTNCVEVLELSADFVLKQRVWWVSIFYFCFVFFNLILLFMVESKKMLFNSRMK